MKRRKSIVADGEAGLCHGVCLRLRAYVCVYDFDCSVTAFGYARTKTRSFDEQDRARSARQTKFSPKRSKKRENVNSLDNYLLLAASAVDCFVGEAQKKGARIRGREGAFLQPQSRQHREGERGREGGRGCRWKYSVVFILSLGLHHRDRMHLLQFCCSLPDFTTQYYIMPCVSRQ